MRNQKWEDYLERDEADGELVSSISPKTTEDLRLADLWIGNATELDDKGAEVVNDLERDLFWRLYRFSGQAKDPIPPERIVNGKIVEWLAGGSTWEQTHGLTVNRRLVSANSASIMTESLLCDPEVRRLIEEQNKIEEQQEQANQQMQAADQAQAQGDMAGAGQLRGSASQLQEQVQAAAQALADKMDKLEASVKGRAMQAGVNQQGNEEAKGTSEEMAAWGIQDGDGSNLDLAQLQALLDQTKSHGVDRLAKLIGRAKGIAQGTISTRKHMEIVLTDAGPTQALEDIFSDELMLLSPSVPAYARAKQMAELMDNGLPGIVKATETKDEGDLVIAVDGSGSMEQRVTGDMTREMLAKALTLGICEAACENGQNWKAFTFGNHNEQTDVISQDTDLATRLKWSTFLFGGGTDFDQALRVAMEQVESMEDPSAADIVMITDGDAGVMPETKVKLNGLKEKYGVRLIAILVDTGYQDLKDIADAFVYCRSGQEIEQAAEQLSKTLWK